MANVSLKTDFKDGDKLFAQQLNNNFSAIVAALAAMNKISWQDDTDESLMYFKGTTEEVAARDIIEGQLLYDYTLGLAYIDHNNTRVDIVSGSVLDVVVNSMDGTQTNKAPSVAAVKTLIVQTLTGDETTKVPSVSTVNDGLDTKVDKTTITSGTADPSGGSDGDIYFKYSA